MDSFNFPKTAPRTFRVSEINGRLKAFAAGLGEVEVRGEISGTKPAGTRGHLYFTLKDDTGAPSVLSVAMWNSTVIRLKTKPRDGMKVVLTGRIEVYEPQGRYQLIASKMREEGKGDLMARFEALKAKLAAEGIFDAATKRRIPAFVRKVAFVTAPAGAVIHDFCSILRERGFAGTVILVPARVQGTGSAEEIARGISLANKIVDLDLLVVGRGGGSLEDLWSFNEEIVARAVKNSRVPVISAVGHETDFSLCDFAADFRAPTPSAAAGTIAAAWEKLRERFFSAAETLEETVENAVNLHASRLELLQLKLEKRSPQNYLKQARLAAGTLAVRLETARERIFSRAERGFSDLKIRFESLRPEQFCSRRRAMLDQFEARLRASGIDATLKRGFAVVFDPEKNIPLTSAAAAKTKSRLRIRFKDGELEK